MAGSIRNRSISRIEDIESLLPGELGDLRPGILPNLKATRPSCAFGTAAVFVVVVAVPGFNVRNRVEDVVSRERGLPSRQTLNVSEIRDRLSQVPQLSSIRNTMGPVQGAVVSGLSRMPFFNYGADTLAVVGNSVRVVPNADPDQLQRDFLALGAFLAGSGLVVAGTQVYVSSLALATAATFTIPILVGVIGGVAIAGLLPVHGFNAQTGSNGEVVFCSGPHAAVSVYHPDLDFGRGRGVPVTIDNAVLGDQLTLAIGEFDLASQELDKVLPLPGAAPVTCLNLRANLPSTVEGLRSITALPFTVENPVEGGVADILVDGNPIGTVGLKDTFPSLSLSGAQISTLLRGKELVARVSDRSTGPAFEALAKCFPNREIFRSALPAAALPGGLCPTSVRFQRTPSISEIRSGVLPNIVLDQLPQYQPRIELFAGGDLISTLLAPPGTVISLPSSAAGAVSRRTGALTIRISDPRGVCPDVTGTLVESLPGAQIIAAPTRPGCPSASLAAQPTVTGVRFGRFPDINVTGIDPKEGFANWTLTVDNLVVGQGSLQAPGGRVTIFDAPGFQNALAIRQLGSPGGVTAVSVAPGRSEPFSGGSKPLVGGETVSIDLQGPTCRAQRFDLATIPQLEAPALPAGVPEQPPLPQPGPPPVPVAPPPRFPRIISKIIEGLQLPDLWGEGLPGTIYGFLLARRDGERVEAPGENVTLFVDGKPIRTTVTNASGRFEFTFAVDAGAHRLDVVSPKSGAIPFQASETRTIVAQPTLTPELVEQITRQRQAVLKQIAETEELLRRLREAPTI